MNTTPGTRLRHLRELLGYTGRQQEFALAIGLTQQSISNMERGKTEPAAKSLNKLFAAFPQVNLSWLVTGAGEPLAGAQAARLLPVPTEPPPTPPAGPAAIVAPAADTVAQFLALLAEREEALEKKHRATLQERAKTHQYTVARMEKSLLALEAEAFYLRGLLGHRPPTPDELAAQQQAAAAAKGKPAGFKSYDDQPAPQAVEMRASRGETAFPRPLEPVAAAPCPLRCAA